MFENNSNPPDSFEDALLQRQIEQGCKKSFNALYEKYWEQTYAEAYKRLKDTHQAKDIVQEIFTHLWLKKDTLRIDNLPAYLNTAVRNKVFKLAAKQKLSHSFFDILETITEKHYQPDANLMTKEFFRSYEAMVKTLPSKKQIIFRLRYHEDMSTKDIALHLGLSRKTVQNQLSRAIEYLKVSLFCLLIVLISLALPRG